ncbi:MAG TPA: hypothetical protein VEX35_04775 [Allosphingosinicella sp.]|nr:hypothetical protein [Allosphingosinicella sp.]
MSLFDGFWGFVLLMALIYFGTGAWAKLDKTHPRLAMALNVALGLAAIACIVALALP